MLLLRVLDVPQWIQRSLHLQLQLPQALQRVQAANRLCQFEHVVQRGGDGQPSERLQAMQGATKP